MGKKAREYVQKHYALELITEKYYNMITRAPAPK
jgi:hypothetical protein